MTDRHLYDVLGVSAGASAGDIRRAYQKLARRYHPDLQPGDREAERRFEEVAEAYRILTDPDRRRRYDAEGGEGWTAALTESREFAATAGRTAERFVRRVEVRRGSAAVGDGERRADSHVSLSFAEAVRGTMVSFSVQREVPCSDCDGGRRQGSRICERCGGRGAVVDLERVRLRIPAGVADGSRLKVRRRGPAAGRDDRSPDLTIVVHVLPHPYFRRRGDDVHGDAPVTLAEAILGAEIEVPTIDGPVRVAIPPGTSGGQLLRLRGRGIKPPRGERGDHYVSIRIVLPSAASREVREMLASLEQDDPRRGLAFEKL